MKNAVRWAFKKIVRRIRVHTKERTLPLDVDSTVPLRIVYFLRGGIGDACMALPAVTRIRERFPRAVLTLFIPAGKYPVVSLLVRRLPVRAYRFSFSALAKEILTHRRFDVALVNTTAVYSVAAEITARLMSRFSAGFCYPGETGRNRILHTVLPIRPAIHDAEQNMQLAATVFGVPFTGNDIYYTCPENYRMHSRRVRIVIHPGCERGYEKKRWPWINFRAVAETCIRRGCGVTLVLGESETDLVRDAQSIAGCTVLTNPRPAALVEVIRSADLFIGNDSGPAHMAAFLGIRSIVLFGPTDKRRCAPLSTRTCCLSAEYPCAPCFEKTVSCTGNVCMERITVSTVLSTAFHLLEKK